MQKFQPENPPTPGDSVAPNWQRTVVGIIIVVAGYVLYEFSGIRGMVTVEQLRELGQNPAAPILIIFAMAGAWTFALPGSVFFFVTPLLFPPAEATVIITIGSAAGTTAGYAAARFIGGPWVERSRTSRWSQFLARHSTFAMIFTLRIVPGSQHGLLNYSAGLLRVGFTRFLSATLLAISIKSFLYATAIQSSIGASNIREALNPGTVGALFGLATLGIAGHVIQKRMQKRDEDVKRE